MAVNSPEVQILGDNAYQVAIKVHGTCDTTVSSNTIILNPFFSKLSPKHNPSLPTPIIEIFLSI